MPLNYNQHLTHLQKVCAENGVEKMTLFGSALKDTFNKDSDIDLVVHFEDNPNLDRFSAYFNIKDNLEDLFGRKIDLISSSAQAPFKNPVFIKNIQNNQATVYERKST